MNKEIPSSKLESMKERELELLRTIAAPIRSMKSLRQLLDSYAEKIGLLSEVHAGRCEQVLKNVNCWELSMTEELRANIFQLCKNENSLDPMIIAYLQISAFANAIVYTRRAYAMEINSRSRQQSYCENYYSANWYVNLFLQLIDKYPEHLDRFNLFGEAGLEGK